MPEYLAPGVFIGEVEPRPRTIEGVATDTATFIGLTRRGSSATGPALLTSWNDFVQRFGAPADLGIIPATNFLAHAAKAYFAEGGRRLRVIRVRPAGATAASSAELIPGKAGRWRAVFAGAAGNGQVTLRLQARPLPRNQLAGCPDGSLVRLNRPQPEYAVKRANQWWNPAKPAQARRPGSGTVPLDLLSLTVTVTDADGQTETYADLGFDPLHPRYVGTVFSGVSHPAAVESAPWLILELASAVTPVDWVRLAQPPTGAPDVSFPLQGGQDAVPSAADWEAALTWPETELGLTTVAAPGHSEFPTAEAIADALVRQAEAGRGRRFALLEAPCGSDLPAVRQFRARFDSAFAALYFPWVVVPDPATGRELILPPSGFVAGIFARTDSERGVHRAPANEVVRSALRFERPVTTDEQSILNPAGINCLRALPGRGLRVWGARTLSSDPEWPYVNVRRYLSYVATSLDEGLRWTVFEPNGERLWADVRAAAEDFLFREWQRGSLLGGQPAEASFVRCDRSTLSQADLDAGRCVVLVGVAVLKPAEFLIFRLGLKAAESG
jgi:hypothetical protein